MVTKEQLAHWKALAKASSPGPWHFVLRKKGDGEKRTMIGAVTLGHQILTDHCGGTYPSNDGAFMAAAREAVPVLIDEVERLRAECDDAHRALSSCRATITKITAHNTLLRDTSKAHANKLNELAREFRESLWT